jgi:hypothetical protein
MEWNYAMQLIMSSYCACWKDVTILFGTLYIYEFDGVSIAITYYSRDEAKDWELVTQATEP